MDIESISRHLMSTTPMRFIRPKRPEVGEVKPLQVDCVAIAETYDYDYTTDTHFKLNFHTRISQEELRACNYNTDAVRELVVNEFHKFFYHEAYAKLREREVKIHMAMADVKCNWTTEYIREDDIKFVSPNAQATYDRLAMELEVINEMKELFRG